MSNWTKHTARAALCAALMPVFAAAGGALAHADTAGEPGAPVSVPIDVCGGAYATSGLVGAACEGHEGLSDAVAWDEWTALRAPRAGTDERRARRSDRDWHQVVRTPLTGPLRGVQDTAMGVTSLLPRLVDEKVRQPLSGLGEAAGSAGAAGPARPVRPGAGKTGGPVRPEDAAVPALPGTGLGLPVPGGLPIGGGLPLLG
ncbi:hypothetical protein [Thermomonospora cellulosilytica]|uniref:Uncharacterized protein n=1 Tax=Thermomonospora cellulosilytica TaxID=1411118 RepID=A0A7W3R626_9ACTN|nr:hypothetical protein [Thermomonospora cellulosilytica]MBA9001708.1 hypothetical protein [Thermomonospora cellulosilytica]